MERGIGDMSTSRKHPASRPKAVVAWEERDEAVRAAHAGGDRRRIALLRLLAEACDAVDPVPATMSGDVVSWRTPSETTERFTIAIEAPRHRITGWIDAEVHVRSGDAARERLGLAEDDTRRIAMRIRTRIPLGPDVADHVGERTIPILGAYARACADALDGSEPAMDELEMDVALLLRVRAAHAAYVAVEGNDRNGLWTASPRNVILYHRGETPLEPGSASMTEDAAEAELVDSNLPPFAMMTVDDEHNVVIRRHEGVSFLMDDPALRMGPVATLRAAARLAETLGETSGGDGA